MSRLMWSTARISALVLTLSPLPLAAQEATLCSGCRLSIEVEAELSSDVAQVVPSMSVSVARTLDGRFIVSPRYRPPQLVVYDGEGRFLQMYTRRGQGPGELTSAPFLAIDPDGAIVAYEERARRRVVRLSADLTHLTTRIPDVELGSQVAALEGGRLVAGVPLASGGNRMTLLAMVDEEGDRVRAFDTISGTALTSHAVVGPSDGRSFWSGRRNASALVRWSTDGEPVERLDVRRDWFEPWAETPEGGPWVSPPEPSTVSVGQLDDDHLALHTRIAASRWEPLFGPDEPVVISPPDLDQSLTFDSVIEIVDRASGEVVARRILEVELVPVAGTSDRFASTSMDELGHVTVTIWRIRFSRGP